MSVGIQVWLISTLYILCWVPIAYASGTLTARQMLVNNPTFNQVIPLVVDSYFWADLLILSPLLGYAASQINGKWHSWEVVAMVAVGIALGCLFQRYVIVPGKYPCSLGGAGETSILGVIHIPYFGIAVAILLLFLFTRVSTASVLMVASALFLLAPADILVPLHFIKKWGGYSWIPDVFGEEKRLYYMIVGTECAVAVLAGLKIAFQ